MSETPNLQPVINLYTSKSHDLHFRNHPTKGHNYLALTWRRVSSLHGDQWFACTVNEDDVIFQRRNWIPWNCDAKISKSISNTIS